MFTAGNTLAWERSEFHRSEDRTESMAFVPSPVTVTGYPTKAP